ncbi:MAG: hypothetical protein M3Y81_09120 [Chloroflexota bacterium]|nr:hypothetical protein [Chloroflexota bacterium]
MEQGNSKARITRQPLSTWSKVLIAALLVNVLAQFAGVVAELSSEGLNVPHTIVGVILLLVAGLAFTGKRWTVLLGALVALVTTVLVIIQPTNSSALLNPGASIGHFVTLLIILATTVVAIVAGVAVSMQNHHAASIRA